MTAPDVPGLLAALARLPGNAPAYSRAIVVGLDAVRAARALRDGRRMPTSRRRVYSPSLAAYAAGRRRNRLGQFVAALVVLALATGCSSSATTAFDQARPATLAPSVLLIPYTDPPTVTGVQRGTCLAGDDGSSPDPVCTPGSVGTTDVDLVCAPRFEATKRPGGRTWTNARTMAIVAYGIRDADLPRVQYDHRVPLGIGGADDVSNLWPQLSDLSRSDDYNSKDKVDTAVWRWVCKTPHPDRRQALAKAQQAFLGDWRLALSVLKIRVTTPLPGR